jgi:hypothetical protein
MGGVVLPQVQLVKSVSIPANGTLVTVPIDTTGYHNKTVFVQTDGDTSVWVKGGPDEDTMATIVTGDLGGGSQAEDAALLWDVNAEVNGFPIFTFLPYTQIVVKNDGASAVECSVWLGGHGR